MIAVDTSALIAILRAEDRAADIREVIGAASDLLIAAPILTEALIVAAGYDLHGEMGLLLDGLSLTVVPLFEDLAYSALRGYMAWGKGHHAAHLNIMDSFSYALATERDCPLLYVGNDFAQTDVRSAL